MLLPAFIQNLSNSCIQITFVSLLLFRILSSDPVFRPPKPLGQVFLH
jgi:hypothetical protein